MLFPAPNLAFFRAVSALLAHGTDEMLLLLLRLSDFTAVTFVMTRKLVVGMSNGFFGDRWGLLESITQGTQGRLLNPLLSRYVYLLGQQNYGKWKVSRAITRETVIPPLAFHPILSLIVFVVGSIGLMCVSILNGHSTFVLLQVSEVVDQLNFLDSSA
jgi:hypothetical protein